MRATPPSAIAVLEARVTEHPWRTLGTAFLLGAWLGLEPLHVPRSRFARAAFAMVGSLALRVAREIALGNLAEHALRAAPRGPGGTSDAPFH
ncbi:MAG TPA: hypothetical protein VF516_40930 [Kofleriaceae bacterium]